MDRGCGCFGDFLFYSNFLNEVIIKCYRKIISVQIVLIFTLTLKILGILSDLMMRGNEVSSFIALMAGIILLR